MPQQPDSPEDRDEQEQSQGVSPKRGQCPHCDSDDIATGLKLGVSAQVGDIGVQYTSGPLGMFDSVEPLRLNLCNECGRVLGFYVRKTDRKWK